MWNKQKAIMHLNAHALPKSNKDCAKFTRQAIEAGGVILTGHRHAKDYGPSLTAAGFGPITDTGIYLPGDVVVINGYATHESGHMAMFNGTNWVSDFVQKDLYPGSGYKVNRPTYIIYRKNN
jgi:hypothetical protein